MFIILAWDMKRSSKFIVIKTSSANKNQNPFDLGCNVLS